MNVEFNIFGYAMAVTRVNEFYIGDDNTPWCRITVINRSGQWRDIECPSDMVTINP